jgi:hypothetical protein
MFPRVDKWPPRGCYDSIKTWVIGAWLRVINPTCALNHRSDEERLLDVGRDQQHRNVEFFIDVDALNMNRLGRKVGN